MDIQDDYRRGRHVVSALHVTVQRRDIPTIIPSGLLEPGVISARAWGVLCFLRSRPDGWQCDIEELRKWFREGRDSLYKALRELADAGYIDLVEMYEHGNLKRTRYVVDADRTTRKPREVVTTRDPDFQDPEIQDPEVPDPEKPDPNISISTYISTSSSNAFEKESTNVLSFSSDTPQGGGRRRGRPSSKRPGGRAQKAGETTVVIDPDKELWGGENEPQEASEGSTPRNGRELALYFRDHIQKFDSGLNALAWVTDALNIGALAATFDRGMRQKVARPKDRITAELIKTMIDLYVLPDALARRGVPPWKHFLTCRVRLAEKARAVLQEMKRQSIMQDPTSQAFREYWGLDETDDESGDDED